MVFRRPGEESDDDESDDVGPSLPNTTFNTSTQKQDGPTLTEEAIPLAVVDTPAIIIHDDD